MAPKAHARTNKDRLNFFKIKNFCFSKYTMNKMKKFYQIWKMFTNKLYVKALIFGIHKGLITTTKNEEYNYKVICGKRI